MADHKFKLILASASPRRKELLGHLKIPFEIHTLNIPEESHHTDPVEFCRHIAILKGDAVFEDYKKKKHQNLLVVSADTIVALEKKIYGKPRDIQDARLILSELSGKTHSVFTGVSIKILHNGKELQHSFVEESKVTFDTITNELMIRYLDTKDSLDKAGAYGIQGASLTFISKVEGCYANVVGFPLSLFTKECAKILQPYTNGKSWFELF